MIYLGTREHNLARHEDEQYNFWLDHAIDKTGEQLGDRFSKK